MQTTLPKKSGLSYESVSPLPHGQVTNAYSILSDPQAKRRYDATGSTSESNAANGDRQEGWFNSNMERQWDMWQRRKKEQAAQQQQQAKVHSEVIRYLVMPRPTLSTSFCSFFLRICVLSISPLSHSFS